MTTRSNEKATPRPWRVVKRSNQLGVRSATLCGPNGFELSLEAGYTGLGNARAVPIDARKVEQLEKVACAVNSHDALIAALEECDEYLDQLVDVVDGDYGEPRPNKEMRLQQVVRAALAAAKVKP